MERDSSQRGRTSAGVIVAFLHVVQASPGSQGHAHGIANRDRGGLLQGDIDEYEKSPSARHDDALEYDAVQGSLNVVPTAAWTQRLRGDAPLHRWVEGDLKCRAFVAVEYSCAE